MLAEDLMTATVASCRADDTLARAAAQLWESDCGLLPVCATDGSSRLVGVITDRDICMSALFQGKPLHELTVSEAMSSTVQVCRTGDSLSDVEVQMRKYQLRRLPVVADDTTLVGMLTLTDLAREATRSRGAGSWDVTIAGVGDTLALICGPAKESPHG